MTRLFASVLLALAASLFVQRPAVGEESVQPRVPVEVRAVGKLTGGAAVATPILTGAASPPVRRQLAADGTAILELATGRWLLTVNAVGFWSQQRSLIVADGAEPVELLVLPSATVKGSFALPRGELAPQEITATFRLNPRQEAEPELEGGTSVCPVGEDLQFECILPAGRLDIGLKAASFVPVWLWDRTLGTGSTTEVGELSLRRGSSVSGWIEVAEGRGDPRDALLRLESLEITGGETPATERDKEIRRFETRANQRGHFAFEAVPPGSYALHVELDGYAPVRRAGIPVVLDSESVLGEPLELYRSRELRVNVEPALDPRGQPWTVQVRTLEDAEAEPREAVVSEGIATISSMSAGRYGIILKDSEGIRRWWQEVDLEPAQEELLIVVETFRVRGRVLFGREGIPADLVFGGTAGVIRIPARADEDGDFEVELPRGGTWPLDVQSPVVQGRKWLRLPEEKPSGGPVRLEVVFPNNEIAGRVLDAEGTPVEGAQVLLFAAPEFRAERSAADGSFAFRGVEEGEAALAARFEEGRGSEELRIRVRASGQQDGHDLVLLNRVRLAGAVESSTGGVPGALVIALPETVAGLGVLPEQAFSQRDGFFEMGALPTTTRLRVAVLAPGFPLQVSDLPADPRMPLLLPVGGEGGELILRPGLGDSSVAPGSVLVLHNGFPLDPSTLAMWAGRNGSRPREKELRVPRLEAGTYTVCTGLDPESFLGVLAAGEARGASCRRVRVHEGAATVVELEELRE